MMEIDNLSLAVPGREGLLPAVSEVSLTVPRGRVLGLVGESGCGKSLTAQSVLRLGEHQGIVRTGGTVRVDGEDVFAMDEERLRRLRGGRVSMVFQEPMTALNPVFSIGEQVMEVVRLHLDVTPAEARDRAIALLGDVGLPDPERLLRQYPGELSGGMRQRVLIAMAMAGEPDWIIADEPTTALDVSVQARIVDLLRELQAERGLGMLLVTHDFGLVAELADDVAVMYAGQIVESAPVMEIFDHPAHPYTRALMACRPEAAQPGEPLPAIPGQVPSPGAWPEGCRFAPRCPWAAEACRRPVAEDAWEHGKHRARCVRVETAALEAGS